jgi:serine protease Do
MISGRLNMDPLIFTPKKSGSFLVVAILFVLLTLPMSACAENDEAITALRRIGRTFAAIAEEASPAVVILKVDVPKQQEQVESEQPERPEPEVDLWVPPSLRSDESRVIIIDKTADLRRLRRLVAAQRHRGLGFIVSADGHILTNHSIVDQASRITAELADGRQLKAKVIGADPATNIAVVKIDADDLPALELGDDDTLSVGDWVIGITNSMGFGRAFSAGMVTAKGRSHLGMAAIEDFVQTDVILHPGDGGGPLLDLDGKVVGINAAIVGREQGLAISLAIPVNMVEFAYKQIMETGTVERGFLGVAFMEIDAKSAKALRLKTSDGVIVSDVVVDSAASKAGVERYDVITEFNGVPIESGRQFLQLVASLKPGTEVEVVVMRDGERQTLTVTLARRPSARDNIQTDTENVP